MSEVLTERLDDQGVAWLALNRPDVRNAFDEQLMSDFTEAVARLGGQARVIVISGEGKIFSAGADLNWMRSMAGSTGADKNSDSNRLSDMFNVLDTCPAPVVGRIHGAAVAGATGLVACCDVAVAASDTIFAFTEVRIGLVPAVISPYVVRKVGYAFARSAFLTAERFSAQRAYEAGLVHRVVDASELDATVGEYVKAFLAASPSAVAKTRDLLDRIVGKPPAEVKQLTIDTIAEARTSADGQEGVTAFLEKRRPAWMPE